MIVSGDLNHARRIAEASRATFNPACDICISRCVGGELYGGVIYEGYTGAGGSIAMHVAGFNDNWMNRDFLWVIFHYPFVQLDCRKVFGQVPEENQNMLEFALKIGFKIVVKIDDVFPDGACILTALARENCRWLKLKPSTLVLNGS